MRSTDAPLFPSKAAVVRLHLSAMLFAAAAMSAYAVPLADATATGTCFVSPSVSVLSSRSSTSRAVAPEPGASRDVLSNLSSRRISSSSARPCLSPLFVKPKGDDVDGHATAETSRITTTGSTDSTCTKKVRKFVTSFLLTASLLFGVVATPTVDSSLPFSVFAAPSALAADAAKPAAVAQASTSELTPYEARVRLPELELKVKVLRQDDIRNSRQVQRDRRDLAKAELAVKRAKEVKESASLADREVKAELQALKPPAPAPTAKGPAPASSPPAPKSISKKNKSKLKSLEERAKVIKKRLEKAEEMAKSTAKELAALKTQLAASTKAAATTKSDLAKAEDALKKTRQISHRAVGNNVSFLSFTAFSAGVGLYIWSTRDKSYNFSGFGRNYGSSFLDRDRDFLDRDRKFMDRNGDRRFDFGYRSRGNDNGPFRDDSDRESMYALDERRRRFDQQQGGRGRERSGESDRFPFRPDDERYNSDNDRMGYRENDARYPDDFDYRRRDQAARNEERYQQEQISYGYNYREDDAFYSDRSDGFYEDVDQRRYDDYGEQGRYNDGQVGPDYRDQRRRQTNSPQRRSADDRWGNSLSPWN